MNYASHCPPGCPNCAIWRPWLKISETPITCPRRKCSAINLELDELITNTVTHGSFEAGIDPRIDIHLRVESNILILTMEDNGSPFDPTLDTDSNTAAPLESRNVGGLGLHLVKNFANRISYEFVEGKNRSTLEHDLKPA